MNPTSSYRYADSPIFRIPVAGGTVIPTVYAPEYLSRPNDFSFYLYRVQEGERYDMLAARFYGDDNLWWVLAHANPEVFYPEDLEAGMQIRIPDVG